MNFIFFSSFITTVVCCRLVEAFSASFLPFILKTVFYTIGLAIIILVPSQLDYFILFTVWFLIIKHLIITTSLSFILIFYYFELLTILNFFFELNKNFFVKMLIFFISIFTLGSFLTPMEIKELNGLLNSIVLVQTIGGDPFLFFELDPRLFVFSNTKDKVIPIVLVVGGTIILVAGAKIVKSELKIKRLENEKLSQAKELESLKLKNEDLSKAITRSRDENLKEFVMNYEKCTSSSEGEVDLSSIGFKYTYKNNFDPLRKPPVVGRTWYEFFSGK